MSARGITVAICTWNRAAYLRDCVLSVLEDCRGLEGFWEVVVVDNNSTDGTAEVLSELSNCQGVKAVKELRRGLSNARNTALANARGDVIIYLDDDVLVPPGYVKAVRAAFESQKADIVGGPAVPHWESRPPFWLTVDHYGVLGLLPGLQSVEGLGHPRIFGANMAFRRDVLATLGTDPFNANLGRKGKQLLGGEESLLIAQLCEKGARVAFDQRASVFHRVPASRLTLRYFLKYMYDGGASDCREWQIRCGKATAPRWLVAEMVKRGAEVPWYFCLGKPTAAVASLLRFTWRLGRVVEYLKIRRLGRKTVDV